MSDRIEPMTHIDIRVVRNLLTSRMNEGLELMNSSNTTPYWKKTERRFQEKCRQAMKLIDDAIAIKEGKYNEVSENSNQNQGSGEANKGNREAGVQRPGTKA